MHAAAPIVVFALAPIHRILHLAVTETEPRSGLVHHDWLISSTSSAVVTCRQYPLIALRLFSWRAWL